MHELDPQLDPPSRGLDRTVELDRLEQELDAKVDSMVRHLASELLADIRQLTVRANALEKEIAALVRRHAPRLLELPGCGALTAIASPAAATANGAPRCTASRSPKSASTT